MARDYAKRKKKSTANRSKRSSSSNRGGKGGRSGSHNISGWSFYGAGVVTGIFLSFLLYLTTLAPAETPSAPQIPEAKPEEPAPRKLQFDFYNKLRERSEVPDPAPQVEPAQDVARPAPSAETFVLQAGSFRLREDADRRRAQLLLLGLEPAIEESTSDSGRWFRVVIGPFVTRAQMNRVRGLTAQQNIDTLQLKRHSP